MAVITVGVLEDELPQAQLLEDWLSADGYAVFHCDTGAEFLSRIAAGDADVLILDWQLPDCEGIDVLHNIREELAFDGPVLFATAKDHEEDIVQGLATGADDYIVKPLRRAELLARVAAVWRRSGADERDVLELGPVKLDLRERRAFVAGEEVILKPTEFDLAVCVFSHRDTLLSRDFLLREVWGVNAQLDTRTVDMHMSRVRKMLKVGPNMGYCIKTVYRHGYRLETL